jgi:rhomboid protease GluP
MLPFRRIPVTSLLLAAIVLTFSVETLASGSLLGTADTVLVRMGANEPSLFWHGQYWRLLTSVFLHIGLMHLLFNGWALLQLGGLFEVALGSARMLVTFLVTGVLASFVSVLWLGRPGQPGGISAGASGAIFGLLGALIAFLGRRRDRLQPWARSLLSQLVFWAVINLILGVTLPGIDNSAHLGGLASGFLLGLTLREAPHPIPEEA